MSLDFNRYKKTNFKKLTLFILSYTTFLSATTSQNVTSPYSILGIGDIDNKDYGRYFISGNAAIARRDESSYNYTNPASLSSIPLKTIHFEIDLRGRNSSFLNSKNDTSTSTSKDFTIKRAAIVFKLNQKTGIAFGIKQYSSVNYKFSNIKYILDGNTYYNEYTDGTGGINNAYFSIGKAIGKRISVGMTASWLFGSLQKITQYYSSALSLDIQKKENDFYNGFNLSGGLQYYSKSDKKWKHNFGLIASVSTKLEGQLTSTYSDGDLVLKKEVINNRKFKLPITVGIGYSFSMNNAISISLEGNYYHWQHQKVGLKNSYSNPSFKFSAGIDYSFKQKSWRGFVEKSFIGIGVNAENSYIIINGNKVWDYSLSFGGGINPIQNLSIHSGIEFGIKGQNNVGQIKENYIQYILGITIKDIWIGTKKYGRFN